MKRFYLFLILTSTFLGMQRDLPISFSAHALEKLKELKVTEQEVADTILNGDRYTDKNNANSIVYAQRTAYPRSNKAREYDQLIVVAARELKNGKNHIITVYYNEGGLKTSHKKPKESPHWKAAKTNPKRK